MPTDDGSDVKQLLRDLKKILEPFGNLLRLNRPKEGTIDELRRLLEKLPDGGVLGTAVDEVREKLVNHVDTTMRDRRDQFGKVLAEFVRAHEGKEGARQSGENAWRVGPVEIELRRDQAQARCRYNRAVVIEWRPIAATVDLEKLYSDSLEFLAEHALPDEELKEIFWSAYLDERNHRKREGASSADSVPVLDFLREVQVCIFRRKITGKRAVRTRPLAQLSMGALLFNLDRYRALGAGVPADMRIGFETGSQAEQRMNKAVTANGLDPQDDYRSYVYVIQAN